MKSVFNGWRYIATLIFLSLLDNVKVCHLKPGPLIGTLLRLYQYVLPPRGASLVPGVDHNKTTDYRHHEASQVIAAIDIFRFC